MAQANKTKEKNRKILFLLVFFSISIVENYMEVIRLRYTKKSHPILYDKWRYLKKKCFLPSCGTYKYFGKNNISVCTEWLESFQNFAVWAMKEGYEPGLTLLHIDKDKDIGPDNCCFVEKKYQNRSRRNGIIDRVQINYKGEMRLLRELAIEHGLEPFLVYMRYKRHGEDTKKLFEKAKVKVSTYVACVNGEELTMKELSKKYNICYRTLSYRFFKGIRGNDLIAPPKGKRAPQN